MIFLVLLAASISLAPITSSSEILLICPFPAPSHWLWIEHFARELVDRGHHVTAVTNHPTKQPHPNYTEIIINPSLNIPTYFPIKNIFEMKFNSDFNNLLMWWKVGLLSSEFALNDPKIKQLIRSKHLRFDLVILEQFFHESFLMFGHKFKAPVVTLGTFGYADNMDRSMGLITPWSFVSHIVLPYTDEMTFKERCYNTFISIFDFVARRWFYIPEQQKMAEKHFKELEGPLPSVLDLERNISMMLINSHISMDRPRPSMPGLVNVGGVHIKPTKPLPKDIQSFLDGAEHGAIYFSLGSYVKSNQMPQEKVKMILNAFKKLPQRVLWKYEDQSIGVLPSNVMIAKWMPQSDILAHKNIILFITHGGIFGTQEGIYRGVPLLFMPLYGDQHRNSIKCIREGYGLSIQFSELTTETLLDRINTIIKNKKYKETLTHVSALFRDNLVSPMEEAMFRIEYVVRHKGARHLKSAAIKLQWYQYLLLDVFAVYLLILLIPILLLLKIILVIRKFILKKRQDDLFKKKSK